MPRSGQAGFGKLSRSHADGAKSEDARASEEVQLGLKSVGSAEGADKSFCYVCKINGITYQCELDTAASDIFMSEKIALEMGLEIRPHSENVVLGDGSRVQTAGIATAVIEVDEITSKEDIHLIKGESDGGVLTLGRSWGRKHRPRLNWKEHTISVRRPNGKRCTIFPKTKSQDRKTSISRMSFKKMARELRKGESELYMARLVPTDESGKMDNEKMESASKVTVTEPYRGLISEFTDVFRQELPDKLPPKRAFEVEINTDPMATPPSRPVIRLSVDEQRELKKQLDELMRKGLIRHSTSPFGAPVFFIKKKDGKLRMVCDYRGLNKITVKDVNPLPLIEETLDQLAQARVFSKFDLVGAYHQLRIKDEDVHKTAIRTRFGTFEWKVLCFGLTNAPAAFTRLAADVFKELNGDCLAFYLDDVIIYSRTMEEHKRHLRKFLAILRKHKLLAKGSKCEVGQREVYFLGQYVSEGAIRVDESLIRGIEEWPKPRSVKDVQRFLGLAGYYRKFIEGYARIAKPISDLIRGKRFEWGLEQAEAFKELKQALMEAPTLALPRIGVPFTVTTDASKFAVGATLEQDGHPVAFISHRLKDAEMNWHTGDQELLAFLISLQKWDVYLRGNSFLLNTDHEPIRYLQSKPKLSPRQQRWLDIFQQYDFEIRHIKGISNSAADALSRRPDLEFKFLSGEQPELRARIMEAQKKDKFCEEMRKKLEDPASTAEPVIERAFRNFSIEEELIVWTGSGNARVHVPDNIELKKDIVDIYHETAHLGVSKIYGSVARFVYWRRMFEDIQRWVASCKVCLMNKHERQRTAGLLAPHDVPKRCWEHVTADFVTEFPTSTRGFDAVLVVVEKLSKRVVFIPTRKDVTAEEVAKMFEAHIFSKFGIPKKLSSDRDPKFTAAYWKTMMEASGVTLNMSTTGHPQTDGQSERAIQTLIEVLRPTVQSEPTNWDAFLPLLEFELNATRQESSQLTPFEIEMGRLPSRPKTRALSELLSKDETAADDIERQQTFVQVARDHLAAAKEAQRYYANRNRQHREFKVGDLVMLKVEGVGANARAELPEKWRPKFMGPLRVLAKIGEVSYKIELPPSMSRAHNVFHVSRLKEVKGDVEKGTMDVIIDADGTVEQEIECILDHKGSKKHRKYHVKFIGETEQEAVWMTRAQLENAKQLVAEYERDIRTQPST